MASSINAYIIYKQQSEQLLDFAVFVSYAVPVLRTEIANVKAGKVSSLPRPDFFFKSNRSTPDDLLKTDPIYESRLASYLLLSAFSFFEAFFYGILDELILFHGGKDEFLKRAETRVRKFMAPHPKDVAELKKKIRGKEMAKLRDKYRKFSRLLAEHGYRFPGELFAAFGLKMLISKRKSLKAFEIPTVLADAFQLNLSANEIQAFEDIRKTRNDIAHGKTANLTMRDSVKMSVDLRQLATKIAAHLNENFFLVERFAP